MVSGRLQGASRAAGGQSLRWDRDPDRALKSMTVFLTPAGKRGLVMARDGTLTTNVVGDRELTGRSDVQPKTVRNLKQDGLIAELDRMPVGKGAPGKHRVAYGLTEKGTRLLALLERGKGAPAANPAETLS